MRTLVIIRDCHAKHNLVWRDCTTEDEKWIRKYAKKRGWKVAVRKERMCGYEDLKKQVSFFKNGFEKERDIKNENYLFILDKGHFDEYKKWFYERHTSGKTEKTAHDECVRRLLNATVVCSDGEVFFSSKEEGGML